MIYVDLIQRARLSRSLGLINRGARRPGARHLCISAYALPLPWGSILSPSATLRVAGLAPQVKVEHTTV
jgi:hypothetical protein